MHNQININKGSTVSAAAFRWLMLLFWTQYTVFHFFVVLFRQLPIIGKLGFMLTPALYVFLTVLALPYLCRKIRETDIIFYVLCILFMIFSVFAFPQNAIYIQADWQRIAGTTLPVYFLGVCYSHEELKKGLFWASLLTVIVMVGYQFYSANGDEMNNYNMDSAYKTLPSIMYLIYWALTHKSFKNTILALLAFVSAFVFGTRGPVLAIVVFLAISNFSIVLKSTSKLLKFTYFATCAFVLVLLLFPDQIALIAQFLSDYLKTFGISTRIFDMIAQGELANTDSRDILRELVGEAIWQHPIRGIGLMGDRVILGIYVHNLVYELASHFGIFAGMFILFFMVGLPIFAYKKEENREQALFILMIACMVFSHLMVSSSYLYDTHLFLLLGMSVSTARRYYKQKKQKELAIAREKTVLRQS